MNKKDIRRLIIEKRDTLRREEVEGNSRIITEKLLRKIENVKASSVFIFLSFGSEVYTHTLIVELLKRGIRVCVPKITEGRMCSVPIDSLDDLVPGRMGILEPLSSHDCRDIDLVVVPGVVFNRRGYRIGYGGGYYDRYLEEIPSHIPKAAIAHHMQVADDIPVDPWDIRVDYLITEKTTYNFRRIREYGVDIGSHTTGPLNKISDVRGVTVGHAAVDTGESRTGVTVVLPSEENPYRAKLTAAVHVINGYGKSSGLMQIEELGQLESPIALTNTLNVGRVQDALVGYMLERSESEGMEIHSINTVVAECNDSYLSNISLRAVGKFELIKAVTGAEADFPEGDVGGGRGMSCHKMKGGIGSASRVFTLGTKEYTIGALVQSNYGHMKDLSINGDPIGERIAASSATADHTPDRGSIVIVIATDLPLTSRQLGRICRRSSGALARLGSHMSHGSGEVVIGFTTALPESISPEIDSVHSLREELLDTPFRAVSEAVEEAVLNSMICASPLTGYRGNHRESLADYIHLYRGGR